MNDSTSAENKEFSKTKEPLRKEESELLNEAIRFATKRHKDQRRKGTSIPYIVHPMETTAILASMKAEPYLLIAGMLHDTIEDTDTTEEEITERFGKEVCSLVTSHTEDKTKSWTERKKQAIKELKTASLPLKMLVMADKTANLRSIYADYRQIGDEVWKRFNAPRDKQAWFYSEIQDALYEMQFYPETETVYWEMVSLFKDLFVVNLVDEENGILYQICDDGSVYCLKKETPQWILFNREHTGDLNVICRRDAEFLEDCWIGQFHGNRNQNIRNLH
ncbi:MAG: HD domain-containing protein [Clostridia bacterium]